jgi:hypothetical protein
MHGHLKLAFGLLLGLSMTGAASAADMAVKSRPLVAPIRYNWTGCYIGGNTGGGWSRVDTTRISQDAVGPAFAAYGRETDNGFMVEARSAAISRPPIWCLVSRANSTSATSTAGMLLQRSRRSRKPTAFDRSI